MANWNNVGNESKVHDFKTSLQTEDRFEHRRLIAKYCVDNLLKFADPHSLAFSDYKDSNFPHIDFALDFTDKLGCPIRYEFEAKTVLFHEPRPIFELIGWVNTKDAGDLNFLPTRLFPGQLLHATCLDKVFGLVDKAKTNQLHLGLGLMFANVGPKHYVSLGIAAANLALILNTKSLQSIYSKRCVLEKCQLVIAKNRGWLTISASITLEELGVSMPDRVNDTVFKRTPKA